MAEMDQAHVVVAARIGRFAFLVDYFSKCIERISVHYRDPKANAVESDFLYRILAGILHRQSDYN